MSPADLFRLAVQHFGPRSGSLGLFCARTNAGNTNATLILQQTPPHAAEVALGSEPKHFRLEQTSCSENKRSWMKGQNEQMKVIEYQRAATNACLDI